MICGPGPGATATNNTQLSKVTTIIIMDTRIPRPMFYDSSIANILRPVALGARDIILVMILVFK